MLIELQVKNFRSFRDPTVFSMAKTAGAELADTHTFESQAPATSSLLRSAAIYGPNASGKTNLVYALVIMKGLVTFPIKEDEPVPVSPFRLDANSRKQPCEFEVIFVSEGVRYQYGFSVTEERFMEEWLLAYPHGRPQRLIDRKYDAESGSYIWGNMAKLAGPRKLLQEATRPKALFLSTAVHLNNEHLKPVFDWFKKTLRAVGAAGPRSDCSMELCKQPEGKESVLAFLRANDINIDDISIEEKKISLGFSSDDMPDAERQRLLRKLSMRTYSLYKLKNDRVEKFEWLDESEGTKKLFEFAGPMLETLKEGYVVIVDELDRHLHPALVGFLVQLFHNTEINTKNAQLVFTTHDTSILNQKMFRRDQIWFCDKGRDRATELFPLTDFSPRKTENIEYGYLSGRYHAFPYIKDAALIRDAIDRLSPAS